MPLGITMGLLFGATGGSQVITVSKWALYKMTDMEQYMLASTATLNLS